ncbi:MAG TPA: nitronate monooxygenase, partial [Bacteroidia bacterium]|nr:nitronate monooxygenase [Bacteroidia bacterium]
VQQLEELGASAEQLKELLGKGRARKGILEGDLINGELEIGQVAAQIHEQYSVAEIMQKLITEFHLSQQQLNNISL